MRRLKTIAIAATGIILLAQPALACPVCFGEAEGPMAQGMNMAILVLLGITGSVLASFAAFFVYLMRRARIGEGDSIQVQRGIFKVRVVVDPPGRPSLRSGGLY